jgi:hypothetical protein
MSFQLIFLLNNDLTIGKNEHKIATKGARVPVKKHVISDKDNQTKFFFFKKYIKKAKVQIR